MHLLIIGPVVPFLGLAKLAAASTTSSASTTSTSAPSTTTTTTTIPEPGRAHQDQGTASWYRAPDGQCAHRSIAMGTPVRVINVSSGVSARCRVASRGPSDKNRVIDLSKTTFARLSDPSRGLLQVKLEW